MKALDLFPLGTTVLVGSLLHSPALAQSWQEDVLAPRGMADRHVTHDFDGDGTADVLAVGTALSTTGSRAAFLYTGNGDGTFLRRGKVQRGLPRPDSLIACDVDGDGAADAVLHDTTTGSVVLLEGDGAGRFGAPRTLAAVGGTGVVVPASLRCADGDGDGDLDLFFSVRDSGVGRGIYWLEQTAPGAFAPAALVSPPSFSVFSFDVADLDGDGDADLLVSAGQGGLVWFRNDGGLALTGPLSIEAGFESGSAYDVRAFDVDRDGTLDVLGTNQGNRRRIAYRRNLGGGAFAPAATVAVMTGPVARLVFGDLDGDGRDDIGVEQDEVRCEAILIGPGATFSPRFPVVSPALEIGAFDLADLDGDGRAEGVYSGELLFSIVGLSAAPVVNYSRNLGPNGAIVSFEQNVAVEPFSYAALAFDVADFTGDGGPDLFIASGDPRKVVLYEGGGDGALASFVDLEAEGQRALSLASADLDGDGDRDLMFSVDGGNGRSVHLARNQGSGSAWTVTPYDPSGFHVLDACDLEDDGDTDLFVMLVRPTATSFEIAVAENVGAWPPLPPRVLVALPVNTFFRGTTIEDMDGDGDADILVGVGTFGSSERELLYYRAEPGGLYSGPFELDSSPGLASLIDVGFTCIEVADFDGDGDRDVLALASHLSGGGVRLYRQAAGTFSNPIVLVPTPTTGGVVGLAAFDADADGDEDFVVTRFRSETERGEVSYYENVQGGAFVGPTMVPTVGIDQSVLASGDFDQDGDVDFVAAASGIDDDEHFSLFTNSLFRSLGSGYCAAAVPNSTGRPGAIGVVGSPLVLDNVARLRAWDLPPATTGYFLTSRIQGFTTSVPNSVGILCLGGEIGRFAGPGQVLNTGSTGTMALDVDLLAFPSPSLGTVSVLAGETWNFQGWTRDAVGGTVTSNFTAATSVTWQ
ncbi:MAG: VCBS repeat-containing protein [Planctomycetota bacterium]